MLNLKIQIMKKRLIFALSMLVATFAFAQNKNVEEVNITVPQFTGNENAALIQAGPQSTLIKKFLNKTIVYPATAAYCNIQGTEVVEFTVTTKGNVRDFKIINSVCPEIDKEVISALEQTNGMWYPGIKNGEPADMSVEIPFTFCASNTGSRTVNEFFKEKATLLFSKGIKILFENGNAKKALNYFDKGIIYLPYDQSLLLARGMCRYKLGDTNGATEDWTRMNDLGGGDMKELASAFKDMKGYDELMAMLKK